MKLTRPARCSYPKDQGAGWDGGAVHIESGSYGGATLAIMVPVPGLNRDLTRKVVPT